MLRTTSVYHWCLIGYIEIMKRAGKFAVCFAAGLLLHASLQAQDAVLPGNPYAVVVARNIFGLNPVIIDTNPPAPPEPPVKIVPNGIMSILGQLQVLFKVAAKPGGKDASYMLTEGQRQDDIEVVKINAKAATVTFNNHGIVQDLPLVVTQPGSTPVVAPTFAPPSAAPGFAPAAAGGANPGVNPFTSRFGNRGARPGNNMPGTSGGSNGNNPGLGSDTSGLRTVPTRGANTEMMQLKPEEQAVMIAAQHAKFQQEGNPVHSLFPPTAIDAEAGVSPTPSPANIAPGGSPTTP